MSADSRRVGRRPGRPVNPVGRDRLLAIAQHAFAANGYAGTSMRELANEAGITKAALFHHFPSKEDLYLEALSSILATLEGLVTAAREVEGGFVERLDTLSVMSVDYLGSHQHAARLLTRELLGGGPYMARGGEQVVQATLHVIAAFLEAGMKDGEIPHQDPRQLAMSIAGLHVYLFAAPEVSGRFLEVPVFSEGHIASRKAAIIRQVRLICGASGGDAG